MYSPLRVTLFAALMGGAVLAAPAAQAQLVLAKNLTNPAIDKAGDALGLIRGFVGAGARAFNPIITHELSYTGQAADLESGSMELKPFERCTFGTAFYQAALRLDCQAGDARTIRVVKGDKAWDEGPTPGYNPNYVDESIVALRRAQVYLYPSGFIRAVAFQDQGQCPTGPGEGCAGSVSYTALDGGLTQVDAVIYGIPYKAILDAEFRPSSIEAAVPLPNGETKTIVATFGEYRNGDGFGEPLDKFHTGSYFPTSFKHTIDGQTVLEAEVYEGWSNPYVVFPNPELLWANGFGTPEQQASAPAIPEVPATGTEAGVANPQIAQLWGGETPFPVDAMGRTKAEALASGEQLVGLAQFFGADEKSETAARFAYMGNTGARRWITFEQDGGIAYRADLPKPLYRPDMWNEVRTRDLYGNAGGEWEAYTDPVWLNYPTGLARVGNPTQIVKGRDENELILLYGGGNLYRVIQVGVAPNCPPHDEALQYDQLFWGNGVGCWQADGSLIVDSMGLAGDKMWIDNQGTFLTPEVRIVERFWIEGEADKMALRRQATIIDQNVLLEPFKKNVTTSGINLDRNSIIVEDVPYREESLGALTDPTYRG